MGIDQDNTIARTAARTAEQLFPERQDDIQRLRSSSQSFDDICRDFELMVGMLYKGSSPDRDVVESCEGLAMEIRSALLGDDEGV